MKLSIILLNYKRPELTLNCVASVYKNYNSEFKDNKVEIVIVDNNSEDESVANIKLEIKKEKYKNVRLIVGTKNLGFGKGCNIGASFSKGEILLFLNNDTKIQDRGFLSMVEFLESDDTVGIVGGKMFNEDGTSQASAGKFYTLLYALMMIFSFQRLGFLYTSPNQLKAVDWVSGGCMMIKKQVFEGIGGFDKDIFMYMEDVDLCFRAKKAGYLTYFYPNIHVSHIQHGSGSRSTAIVYIYQSLLIFYKKHMPRWQYFLIQSLLKLKARFAIFLGMVFKKPFLIKRYEEALAGI